MILTQANKNFYTNILHLLVNLAVGLLYTPYLVHHLGMTAYGVLPLALLINQYINILSMSLVDALSRFYSVKYREGNNKEASSYFSTAIVICVVFAVIALPILIVAIQNINKFLEIPTDLLEDAKLLFLFSVLSFLLSIISNCFNITLYADNYLDKINTIKITRQVSKVAINVILFVLFIPNIVNVGIAYLLSEIIVLVLSVIYYLRKKPLEIHLKIKLYNRSKLFVMAAMLLWVSLQRLGDVFLYKVDTIFMNLFFGIRNTGILGAVSEFGSYVVSITGIFGTLLGPLLLIAYSKKEVQKYTNISICGGYILALFCSLFCGLLIGSANEVLSLWLGKEYSNYGFWLVLKIIVIPYTTFGAVFSHSYLYAKYNKIPALVSLVISIFNVTITYIFLRLQPSVIGFLLICLIFIILQGLFMNLYFFNKFYSGYLNKIFKDTILFTVYMLITVALTKTLMTLLCVDNIMKLLVTYTIIAIVMLIVLDALFLRSRYRKVLYEIIPVYGTMRENLITFIKRKF